MKWGLRLLGYVTVGVTVLFVLVGIFWVGARVSGLDEDHAPYDAGPGIPFEGPVPLFGHRPERYGTLGSVLRVEGGLLIVHGRFGIEHTVHAAPDTIVERARRQIQALDIRPGEWIIAIGAPRPDGSLEARFIRVSESPLGER